MKRSVRIVFASLLTALLTFGTALSAGVALAQEHAAEVHETAHEGATAEGAAHEEHAAAGHEGHELPSLNWTDVLDTKHPAVISLFINFGLLIGLYYVVFKKPTVAALKQRRVTIGKDIEDAQKMLAEAKERAKKYQGDLKNADADAETTRAALVASGKGEVERQLSEAHERAERMKRDAERLVEQERKQLQQDLHLETVDLAMQDAARLLEKAVTPEDHVRLAQDLLAELAKHPGATAGGAP